MAEIETEKNPRKLDVSRQLDQEKIDYLTKRVDELLNSNNSLRNSNSKNEKDTHDVVLYFQREMEMKDDIIARLNEELVKRETQLKFDVEKMKKKFEADLSELRTGTDTIIVDLTARLVSAENELLAVETYKIEKDRHDERVRQLDKSVLDQRQQMFNALEEQERKFLEEKAHIFKDLDDRKIAFREVALKEAKQAMSAEAKKILADNNRMFEELKFHHTMTAELEIEKATLQNQLAVSKREVQILTDKEIEYAKQMFHKTKEIKVLRERVETLEKHQILNVEKFKQRTKEIRGTVSQELEDATLDAAGLRRLMTVKNQELRQMKSLAATIISQRSDVEQFFLEALREVREAIRIERKKADAAAKFAAAAVQTNITKGDTISVRAAAAGKIMRKSMSQRLPSLSSSYRKAGTGGLSGSASEAKLHHHYQQHQQQLQQQPPPSKFPVNLNERIFVRDLSWEDKELVLRVLFAKMNGLQTSVDSVMKGTGAGSSSYADGNAGGAAAFSLAGTMPAPVFLSEGAGDYFPDSMIEEATQFQKNFEIPFPLSFQGGGGGGGNGGLVQWGMETDSRAPINDDDDDDDDELMLSGNKGNKKFIGTIGGESYHIQVQQQQQQQGAAAVSGAIV